MGDCLGGFGEKMCKKRVLIFPCGSEIGLEVNRALANDIHFEMFGASSLPDHGKFVFKNYIEGVPFVDSDNFVSYLVKVCEDYKIDFIVPSHDSVVLKLAQNADKFCNVKILTSPVVTCEIARSKKKTYEVLKNEILTPLTYNITDENIVFPVFIKPDVGQGSKGAKKVNDRQELDLAYKENNQIVISEFLPNEEYTVDCFTNKNGDLLFAQGRTRTRISNGIAVNSLPVDDKKFLEIAEKINKVLKFRGMWFFQLKKNFKGEYCLLELAPRIAGTMGLYRRLGVNFILLALYDAMGFDVKILKNNFALEIDRALYTACKHDIDYNCVYVDFDDTIINSSGVNTDVIKFLYQAKNENKKIVLLTKHEKNISETFEKYSIAPKLFDSVMQIEKSDNKYKYISEPKSIFIDDSYSERIEVYKNKNIPVFGVDSIDVLFDILN